MITIKKQKPSPTPSANGYLTDPENTTELLNKFGTYEIQPTADTENLFPTIAQGLPDKKKKTDIDEN